MPNLLDGMDEIYTRMVPEFGLATVPDETRATCASCAMQAKPGADPERPVAFTTSAACCTYNPALMNHVVGRILRRGDLGAEKMRARILQGEGVTAYSVSPPAAWSERYAKNTQSVFGRDASLACPYWVDGFPGCTIWRDRNSVCRTWFCKYVDGSRGRAVWQTAREAIDAIDRMVAAYCVALGSPPSDGARPGEWMGWYRWCAERVDLFDQQDFARVRTPRVLAALDALVKQAAEERAPLPDVVVPSLLSWFAQDEHVYASGYSAYDMDVLPKDLFVFLSRLDGTRPWREALGDEPGIDASFVRFLWDRGMLAPGGDAFVAGTTSFAFREGPWGDVPELQSQIVEAFTNDPPESA